MRNPTSRPIGAPSGGRAGLAGAVVICGGLLVVPLADPALVTTPDGDTATATVRAVAANTAGRGEPTLVDEDGDRIRLDPPARPTGAAADEARRCADRLAELPGPLGAAVADLINDLPAPARRLRWGADPCRPDPANARNER